MLNQELTDKYFGFFDDGLMSKIIQRMKDTVEDSPWHREANVWVHTMMTIGHYVQHFAEYRTETQNLITIISLLFHDVGKPEAEEEKSSKEDGHLYRSYAGHEIISANEFKFEYLRNVKLRELLGNDVYLANKIRFVIENHLPYGLKKKEKVLNLKTALEKFMGDDVVSFYDHLICDGYGRISDDHDKKKSDLHMWIDNFKAVKQDIPKLTLKPRDFQPMVLLIGPSGSSKSTITKTYEGAIVFCMDDFKYSYYNDKHNKFIMEKNPENYNIIWEYAAENESDFNDYFFEIVRYAVKNKHGPFISDNTNLSKKRRARFVEIARSNHMKVIANQFWVPKETLIKRLVGRDKNIPYKALMQQIYSESVPWLGSECDEFNIIQSTDSDL